MGRDNVSDDSIIDNRVDWCTCVVGINMMRLGGGGGEDKTT